MGIAFRRITSAPLAEFEAAAPDGVVIGIIGENGSGKSRLLRLAGGVDVPQSGRVEASGCGRLLGPADGLELGVLDLGLRGVLCIDNTFARHDLLVRERAAIMIGRLRRRGITTLLVSHEEDLLRRLADEVWWLKGGGLAGRGDPDQMLRAYRKEMAQSVRAWGQSLNLKLAPAMRRGDGRAEVVRIETLGEDGRPTMIWRSGELAVVRVTVRFEKDVVDPVIGMMIRTRIGLNVYGTNTELEKLRLGPVKGGQTITLQFAFRCELCPEEYTLTVASHDPDGVWHDWLEDAIAFSVTDERYTAGVANLRATVSLASAG
ncbi:MAG TPA: Wzt carbohydrate-binding domain-containing protein [Bryobacteraceae bacterium]|nr:Wzt carbohydrate-binding domain-containing protein [Bryobacteraceae bacterium]